MIDLAEETVTRIIQELKRHAIEHQCGFCTEILREEFGIEVEA